MEQLKVATDIDLVHVPYRGIGPAFVDILGGQTQAMFPGLAAALPHIKAGKVKPLAVTGLKRHPLVPEVPTFEESGYKGFDGVQWYGIVGPAHLPADVTSKLNEEINRLLATPGSPSAGVVDLMSPSSSRNTARRHRALDAAREGNTSSSNDERLEGRARRPPVTRTLANFVVTSVPGWGGGGRSSPHSQLGRCDRRRGMRASSGAAALRSSNQAARPHPRARRAGGGERSIGERHASLSTSRATQDDHPPGEPVASAAPRSVASGAADASSSIAGSADVARVGNMIYPTITTAGGITGSTACSAPPRPARACSGATERPPWRSASRPPADRCARAVRLDDQGPTPAPRPRISFGALARHVARSSAARTPAYRPNVTGARSWLGALRDRQHLQALPAASSSTRATAACS
jgi:hypothetical protein